MGPQSHPPDPLPERAPADLKPWLILHEMIDKLILMGYEIRGLTMGIEAYRIYVDEVSKYVSEQTGLPRRDLRFYHRGKDYEIVLDLGLKPHETYVITNDGSETYDEERTGTESIEPDDERNG